MINNRLWTRSSTCADGSCVDARYGDGRVEMRDGTGEVRTVSPEYWLLLLGMAKACRLSPQWWLRRFRALGLSYDVHEVIAWLDGVARGDFDRVVALEAA